MSEIQTYKVLKTFRDKDTLSIHRQGTDYEANYERGNKLITSGFLDNPSLSKLLTESVSSIKKEAENLKSDERKQLILLESQGKARKSILALGEPP